MVVGAMLLATCYGVFQLHALGTATRTIQWRTWLLAIAAGAYGCGVAALLLQWLSVRALDLFIEGTSREIVRVAGYTVDPFIEEFVKLAPLAMAAYWARGRWRWGLTDYVILGAASGAGFGLLEALMRYGATSTRVVDNSDGWIVALPSFEPPFIGHPQLILQSWVPAPASGVRLMEWGGMVDPSIHVVWSSVAGLGLGLLFRYRGWARWLGLCLILFAGYDHAGHNARLDSNRSAFFQTAGALSDLIETLAWLLPALAIVVAVIVDRRVLSRQRSHHPELLLQNETDSLGSGLLTVGRFCTVRPFWTVLVGVRFTQQRRSTMYGLDGYGQHRYHLHEKTIANVDRINNTSDPQAWQDLGILRQILGGTKPPDCSSVRWLLKRWWPLLLWIAMASPALLFYGSHPTQNGAVKSFASNQGFAALLAIAAVSVTWTTWRLVKIIRALSSRNDHLDHQATTGLILRCWIAVGTLIFGGVVFRAVLAGEEPSRPFWSNSFHIITALGALLLVAGVTLVIAAIVFFPPFAVVALAGGGTFLVPTLTASFVIGITAGTGLGVAGYALSQADHQSNNGTLRTSAGRGDGPSPNQSSRPPGVPAEAAVVATLDALGRIAVTDAPGNEPVPTPTIDIDHNQYEDLNGDLRWSDNNQLVADQPNRPIYQDTDGTWRFADTHQAATGPDGLDLDPERVKELAPDPAEGGSIKGKHVAEAEVGAGLEASGKVAGLRRDPQGGADFIDEDDQLWDVKAFRSEVPGRNGGYEMGRAMESISEEISIGENIMIDTRHLNSEDLAELRSAIEEADLDDNVLYWP